MSLYTQKEFGLRISDCGLRNFFNPRSAIRIPQFRRQKRRRPNGVALLLCIFILSIVTVWLVDMLYSQAIYQSALRNTIEYEQALYMANAGVHHVAAQLESSTAWRGTVTAGRYSARAPASPGDAQGEGRGSVHPTP